MQVSGARHFCHFGQYGCLLFQMILRRFFWNGFLKLVLNNCFPSGLYWVWYTSNILLFLRWTGLFICMTKAVLHAGVLIDQESLMGRSMVSNRLCIIVEHKRIHPSPSWPSHVPKASLQRNYCDSHCLVISATWQSHYIFPLLEDNLCHLKFDR